MGAMQSRFVADHYIVVAIKFIIEITVIILYNFSTVILWRFFRCFHLVQVAFQLIEDLLVGDLIIIICLADIDQDILGTCSAELLPAANRL